MTLLRWLWRLRVWFWQWRLGRCLNGKDCPVIWGGRIIRR